MTGYIRVSPLDLRMRDYTCYKALYCGLCRSMGKCTGNCSRLSLQYDFVFLSALRMALLHERPQIKKFHCFFKCFQKKYEAVNSPTLHYSADASAILTYEKLKDDKNDEKGFRRFRAKILLLMFKSAYKKASKRNPQLASDIASELKKLSEWEKDENRLPLLSIPASCFGNILSTVFSNGLEGENKAIAKEIGQQIGSWIYLCDALDDFEKDKKKNRFNPLIVLYGKELSEENKRAVMSDMMAMAEKAKNAFALASTNPDSELTKIIENILTEGLYQVMNNPNGKEKTDGKEPV